MSKILGNDYVLLVNDIAVGCEVSFNLQMGAETIDLAGRNYDWNEFVVTTFNATIDVNCLVDTSADVNFNAFFDWFTFKTLLSFQIDDLNSTNNNFFFEGRIVEYNLGSSTSEFVTCNIKVKINGRISRFPAFYLLDYSKVDYVKDYSTTNRIISNG